MENLFTRIGRQIVFANVCNGLYSNEGNKTLSLFKKSKFCNLFFCYMFNSYILVSGNNDTINNLEQFLAYKFLYFVKYSKITYISRHKVVFYIFFTIFSEISLSIKCRSELLIVSFFAETRIWELNV